MKDSSPCSGSHAALTLVEVVVALLLLASLLVGMISAFGIHHRQIGQAQQRLQAIAAADRLLADWYDGSQPNVPRLGQGVLRGHSTYVWRTVPMERSFIKLLPVEVVRLQIFPEQALVEQAEPLAQVDVLLAAKESVR